MSKGTVNKVILIGRLGDDPEVRYTKAGEPVVTLSVATNEGYKDRDGKFNESTEWHKVVCFRSIAEFAKQYLKKGGLVYVDGKLKTDKYQVNGEDRYKTGIVANEIQMLGGKSAEQFEESGGAPSTAKSKKGNARSPHPAVSTMNSFEDDDIPF